MNLKLWRLARVPAAAPVHGTAAVADCCVVSGVASAARSTRFRWMVGSQVGILFAGAGDADADAGGCPAVRHGASAQVVAPGDDAHLPLPPGLPRPQRRDHPARAPEGPAGDAAAPAHHVRRVCEGRVRAAQPLPPSAPPPPVSRPMHACITASPAATCGRPARHSSPHTTNEPPASAPLHSQSTSASCVPRGPLRPHPATPSCRQQTAAVWPAVAEAGGTVMSAPRSRSDRPAREQQRRTPECHAVGLMWPDVYTCRALSWSVGSASGCVRLS